MFRKLRRRWAHKSIKEFLEKYLPEIDLGELKSFKCEDFRLGDYLVTTTIGKYKLCFWELVYGAKEFTLTVFKDDDESEFIRFSIKGNIFFTITPDEYVIDRESKRQVVNFRNGRARVYPMGKKTDEVDYNHIEYKRPIMASKFVCISQVIDKSCGYVYIG